MPSAGVTRHARKPNRCSTRGRFQSGGAPSVWFTDPRLAGDPLVPFGVNGIRFDKNNKNVYVSVTAESGTLDGVIYRLPLANPTAGHPGGPALYVQPNALNLDAVRLCIDAVKAHPGRLRLSLQTHKLLHIP